MPKWNVPIVFTVEATGKAHAAQCVMQVMPHLITMVARLDEKNITEIKPTLYQTHTYMGLRGGADKLEFCDDHGIDYTDLGVNDDNEHKMLLVGTTEALAGYLAEFDGCNFTDAIAQIIPKE